MWDDFIKDNRKAKSLRTHGLAFPELCKTLYEGVIVTEPRARGNNCSDATRSQPVAPPELPGISENELNGDNDAEHTSRTMVAEAGDSTHGESDDKRTKASDSSTHGESDDGRRTTDYCDIDERIVKVMELFIKNKSGPSVEECAKKLN